MATADKLPWALKAMASGPDSTSRSERSRISGVYFSLTRTWPSLSVLAIWMIPNPPGRPGHGL